MAWRVARSLLVLHDQLKAGSRAAPPATDPDAWGTICDTQHLSSSDHCPHDFPGWGDDIVTAADFPNAPTLGLNAHQVLDDIRRSHDPRVKYGISNGQMFSSYPTSSYPAWTWRPYTGTDGHFTHGHLSVVGDARADGTQPWQTIGANTIMTLDSGEARILANTHDRVEAIRTLKPYGIASDVPLAGALAGIASQASSNGSGISELKTALGEMKTAMSTASSGGVTQEMLNAAVKAALLDPAVLAAFTQPAFEGAQRAERE